MNRLQLVQAVRREGGVGGGNTTGETPTSTLNQTGEYGQLVMRVDEAWNQIQQGFKWDFLWENTTVTIPIGTNLLAGSIPAFRYIQTKGRTAAGAKLQYFDWDFFDARYPPPLIQDGDTPQAWTVAPDKSVRISTKPVAANYVLSVQRYKNPIPMTADADVPALAVEHHMMIVWKALMLHYKHEVAGAEYRSAKDSYDEKLMALGLLEKPNWSFGEPLLIS
jgi:hypothetical protein